MKRKRIDWDALAPLGLGGRLTVKWICAGLVFAVFFSWTAYAVNLANLQRDIYYWISITKRELVPGTVMKPFYLTLEHVFWGFEITALCMLPLAVWHYLYHYQDSRSIYLMRRLPDRRELRRRCLTIPLLGAAACVLLAAAHLLVFYAVYEHSTPKACLQPGQWRMLWENLFN